MIRRTRDVSRLEGFSDAVFGFAITLLVVSLAVPKSFDELLNSLAGLPAFAASFGLLAYIWYAQYSYFRKYDFEDLGVVLLNLALLFVVLVYVYPLKFLYAAVFSPGQIQLRPEQGPLLMVIYGAGFAAVFLVLALLHLHAYRSRAVLGLDAFRVYEARAAIFTNAATAAVGVLSGAIALLLPTRSAGLAGFVYFLIAVPAVLGGTLVGRRRRLEASRSPSTAAPRTSS